MVLSDEVYVLQQQQATTRELLPQRREIPARAGRRFPGTFFVF